MAGGDIPPYMSFVNEAKAQYEATKKSNNKPLIEPPILKKIPMPISQSPPQLPPQPIPKNKFALPKKGYAKKPPVVRENSDPNPFSMLSGMLIPSWFQDQSEAPPE